MKDQLPFQKFSRCPICHAPSKKKGHYLPFFSVVAKVEFKMSMYSFANKLKCTHSPSDMNFSRTKENSVLQTIHLCLHIRICKRVLEENTHLGGNRSLAPIAKTILRTTKPRYPSAQLNDSIKLERYAPFHPISPERKDRPPA